MKIGDIVWVNFGYFDRLGKIIGQYGTEPYEYYIFIEKGLFRGMGTDKLKMASDEDAMLWMLEN